MKRMTLLGLLALTHGLVASLAAAEGAEATKAAPIVRESRVISGWTVSIDRRLLERSNAETQHALDLLKTMLDEITRVVPKVAVGELQKVALYFSPEYPSTPPRAEFHPGAGWLREHGRDPVMALGVEFTNVRIFEAEVQRMPNFALHELAHAYHHRVLGFDEPRIIAAYERAKSSGTYDKVERQDSKGRRRIDRAYAMTNASEYFAECTEAFFATNDFFPFTKEELRKHDPEMFNLLQTLWSTASK